MVKLQTYKNKHFLTVPIEKIKRANLNSGDEFDVDVTSEGNLIFVKLKNKEVKND
ncbi:hypothetical protein HYX18_02155 [Candidatus Woesearchaeota archaeon]|nr:hypothetical protein [Candidatus Woesearchaeota archaeon]